MSVAKDSSTELIYVHLIDEGTTVLRPTLGESLGDDRYRVLADRDYDPDDEHWQFPPGTVVRCAREDRNGEHLLVAHEAVSQAATSG